MSTSLRLRLSVGLLAVTVTVGLLAGTASFLMTYDRALQHQDEQLERMSSLIDHQPHPLTGFVPVSDSAFFAQVLDPHLPVPLPSGIDTLREGFHMVCRDGGQWRVFIHRREDGTRIAVGQDFAERKAIARRSAAKTATPLLLLMPLLVLSIRLVIGRAFKPLLELSRDIDASGLDRLHPLDPALAPAEIHPFVHALNGLLERAGLSLSRQRRFVADAAHELRTPLTALSLRAQRLGGQEMSETARKEFTELSAGIARTQRLVDQLLTLARTQEAPADAPSVPLEDVLRSVLEDLLPLALERRIDLGIAELSGPGTRGPEAELRAIVRNLVENALRYAPEGGRVDLSLVSTSQGTLFSVEDDGPGIPPAERERVFDPFYRPAGTEQQGSGLGLSIVRVACERLEASVQLLEAREGGLRADVLFPKARA